VLKKLIINTLKYLFFLMLGLVLLWLSFRTIDLNALWDDVRSANYYWMVLAVVFAIISHVFRALRWNLLINSMGYRTRTTTTFSAVMIGYLANTAVPRMGELMRCGVLSRKEKVPFNALFGSVISERLFDLIVLALLLVSVVAFQWALLGDFVGDMTLPFVQSISRNVFTLSLFGLSVVAVVALLWWLRKRYHNHLEELPGYPKIKEIISGLLDGIKTIKRMRQKWLFLFYTVMIWFFYILMTWMPLYMLDETAHLGLRAGITLLAIGSLGIVAPVPGGIGAYHFIGKAVLVELFMINPIGAGSFVAITHAGQTLLNVTLGGFAYLWMFFIDHKKASNDTAGIPSK
jgi:uncharacterized protein (TIRG00374 family)